MWKKALQSKGFWLGLALSGAGLWFALNGVDLGRLKAELREVPWVIAFGVGVFSVGASVIRSWRWKVGIESFAPAKFTRVLSAFFVGLFGLNVIPMRIGELLRVFVLSRNSGFGYGQIMATVVFERIMDGLVVVTLFATALFFLPAAESASVLGPAPRGLLFTIPAAFIICLILLYVFWKYPNAWKIRLDRLARPFGRMGAHLAEGIEKFSGGLTIFADAGRFARYAFWSFAAWLMMGAYLFLNGFVLGVPLTFMNALVVLTFTVVGAMIPAAPGFVGTYHALCKAALVAFGVPAPKALTFAVVTHAVPYVAHTLIGFLFSLREHVRYSDLPQAQ